MLPDLAVFPDGIEPGEAILAVTGVRPLLTREVERITAPMWREIETLNRRITRLAQQLARGSLEDADAYPAIDYDPTLEAFTRPPDPVQVEAMLQDVPLSAGPSFLGCAARAYNYLRDRYPVCAERTIFGVNTLEPGTFAIGMFEDLLEAVDRPLTVFQMIADGRFVTPQALAMQAVYPTLYMEIAVAVVTAGMDEKVAHPNWEPDFGRGISVLLGIPGMDPNLRAQLAAPPPPPPAPPAPPRQTAERSRRARLVATKSDRMELEEPTT